MYLSLAFPIYDEFQLRQEKFKPCHEKELINTIPTISHNLYVSSKSVSLLKWIVD